MIIIQLKDTMLRRINSLSQCYSVIDKKAIRGSFFQNKRHETGEKYHSLNNRPALMRKIDQFFRKLNRKILFRNNQAKPFYETEIS